MQQVWIYWIHQHSKNFGVEFLWFLDKASMCEQTALCAQPNHLQKVYNFYIPASGKGIGLSQPINHPISYAMKNRSQILISRVFPKVANAASADSFQGQIALTFGRIISVSDFCKNSFGGLHSKKFIF